MATFVLGVRTNWGYSAQIEVPCDGTIGDLKRMVAEREGIDPEQLQAFYRGKVMSSVDEQKLSTLQHSTHVTLVAPPCVKAGQPGAPLPRDRPAAALPFVSAMAVPGREGAVEQIYVPPPDEPSARIGFRTLTGQNIDVPVPLDRPFGWIKMRILEMVIVYNGTEVRDEQKPRELGLCSATVLHLGRIMERNALDERMFEDRLRAHCVHCHTPSVQLGLRPGCPNCDTESVLVTSRPLAVGTSSWSDMLQVRITCLNQPSCGYVGPGATKLLCLHRSPAGDKCPSRVTRTFDLTFRPALVPEEGMTLDETNSKMLVDFLNSLFGYPHDGGLEYVRPAAE